MPALRTKADLLPMRRIKGNTEPIGAQLKDQDDAVIDVTGLTIKFRMVNTDTQAVKINNAAATIDDAVNGKVSYTPVAGDVDTVGTYAIYFVDDATNDRLFPYDGARWILDIVEEYTV